MGLGRLLKPCETTRTVFDVDYERLRHAGKRAILFDLDNTLRPRWAPALFPGVEELLARLHKMGFTIGIVTNRKYIRRDPLVGSLSSRMHLVHNARKPCRKAFRRLLADMDLTPGDAVMVGDRRWTDVLGANRLGLYSILIVCPEETPERAQSVLARS